MGRAIGQAHTAHKFFALLMLQPVQAFCANYQLELIQMAL